MAGGGLAMLTRRVQEAGVLGFKFRREVRETEQKGRARAIGLPDLHTVTLSLESNGLRDELAGRAGWSQL